MTTYEFRYRLNTAPEPRTDGSAQVSHDIDAIFREAGSSDAWVAMAGHHKSILIPAAELQTALGSGTNQQKIAAYKTALAFNLNSQSSPMSTTDWSAGELQAFADANDEASAARLLAHEFITVILGQSYPVPFSV